MLNVGLGANLADRSLLDECPLRTRQATGCSQLSIARYNTPMDNGRVRHIGDIIKERNNRVACHLAAGRG
jgi:hypothetical protein